MAVKYKEAIANTTTHSLTLHKIINNKPLYFQLHLQVTNTQQLEEEGEGEGEGEENEVVLDFERNRDFD